MSKRKIVGGAGTAILITAAVGYGLAPDFGPQRTKVPTPKRFDPEQAGPSVSLRRPLPTPSFGAEPDKAGTASPQGKPVPAKARLAGSGSDVAILAQAQLEAAAARPVPVYKPLLPPEIRAQVQARAEEEAGNGLPDSAVSAPPPEQPFALAEASTPVSETEPHVAPGDGTAAAGQGEAATRLAIAPQAVPVPAQQSPPAPLAPEFPKPAFGLSESGAEATYDTEPTAPEGGDEGSVETGGASGSAALPDVPAAADAAASSDVAAPGADASVRFDGAAEQAQLALQSDPAQRAEGETRVGQQGADLPPAQLAAVDTVPVASPAGDNGTADAGALSAEAPPTGGPVPTVPEADQAAPVAPALVEAAPGQDALTPSETLADAVQAEQVGDPGVAGAPLAPPVSQPPAEASLAQVPEYTRITPAPSLAVPVPPASRENSGSSAPQQVASYASAPRNEPPPAAGFADAAPAPYASLTAGLIRRAGGEGQGEKAELTGGSGQPANLAGDGPLISYQDELIMEVRVNDATTTDTIIAYGTRGGLYLPLGPIARILDLAITVTDEGRYAHGWILDEARTLTIDLRSGTIEAGGKTIRTEGVLAAPFDGELYLRADQYEALFPLKVEPDLRTQTVKLTTLETFPFEERLARMVRRARLEANGDARGDEPFERIVAPYRPLSIPTADIELRAVSDSTFGTRAESDIFVAGDLGYLAAEGYFSGDTINGPTASLLKVGRMDPDAQLLGPMEATSFALGDINSGSMPLGLRSVAGRGATITNAPSQIGSVFDRVDLRGILPDGYEVELYRNDILIGSTREAVNGQYEFLQIPVDFGLNVFRFVFFGPQGQRSEVVERISVGDGRLPQGKLVYSFDAAQKQRNLLGVRPPNFIERPDYGDWRSSAQLSYGVTSGLTGLAGAAFFEDEGRDRWLATTGLRTSLAGIAVKADAGVADGGSYAFGAGVGGRFGRSSVTVSHTEYGGEFPDETVALGTDFLRRATEVDLNTSVSFGGDVGGVTIPISARFRNYHGIDGRNTLSAGARASLRTGGLIFSNTADYSRISGGGLAVIDQLFGSFDLATLGRSDTRSRFSLGYALLPEAKLLNAGVEIDHRLDERTALRGSAGYFFQEKKPSFGLSAIREFDTFTLGFDANYSFVDDGYFVGLRLGYSLGRDPLRGRVFMTRPGLASAGGATLRAFRDLDGDGLYGPADEPVEGVDFVSFNRTGTTDAEGIAQLSSLGVGRAVSIQMDTTTLPDIDLAPVHKGVEIVPRPGMIQAIDYPIVSLSEVEGTARFADAGGRGVSGVRLQLLNEKGVAVSFAKTEVDGYFFFERVQPGRYTLAIDPDQKARLQLCDLEDAAVAITPASSVVSRDLAIRQCD